MTSDNSLWLIIGRSQLDSSSEIDETLDSSFSSIIAFLKARIPMSLGGLEELSSVHAEELSFVV